MTPLVGGRVVAHVDRRRAEDPVRSAYRTYGPLLGTVPVDITRGQTKLAGFRECRAPSPRLGQSRPLSTPLTVAAQARSGARIESNPSDPTRALGAERLTAATTRPRESETLVAIADTPDSRSPTEDA